MSLLTRPRVGLLIAVILGALSLGMLTAFQPVMAAVFGVLALGAVMAGLSPLSLSAAALVLALAAPTGWSMSSALPFLNLRIGEGSISVQILLVLLALVVYTASALPSRASADTAMRFPLLNVTVSVWLGVIMVSLLVGVPQNGTKAALSDVQVYLLYACMLIPLIGARRPSVTSAGRITSIALVGLTAYGLWVMAVLFSDSLHSVVFAGSLMDRTRVGFGTSSLLIMFVPLALACLESPALTKRVRLALLLCLSVMGVTVMAAQSRALLAGLLTAVAVYFLWPRGDAVGRRRRVTSLAALTLVALLGISMVLTSQDLTSTAASFLERGPVTAVDTNLRVRVVTNALLLSRLSQGATWLTGLGMGSTAVTVVPSGLTTYPAFSVDNAFLTVALKAGVMGALSLVAMIAAIWLTALRVAKKGSSLARAIASSLPLFVAVTGLSTAHLVNAVSIPIGLAAIVAVLIAEGTRLSGDSAVVGHPLRRRGATDTRRFAGISGWW